MIIRLSAKLAAKVKVPLSQTLEAEADPFADWSANLFRVDRVQYIIVTNTTSLYSVIFEGKGITTADKLITSFLNNIEAYLQIDEHPTVFEKYIKPLAGDISFSKALNRSVTGSMVDLVHMAQRCMLWCGDALPEVCYKVNRAPMSYLGYSSPDLEMKRMVGEGGGI